MLHRSGVTLIEVLVAIFIMGVGLLALLTLFPLGALTMAQAIKDDRCAQAAANAEAIVLYRDLRNNGTVRGRMLAPFGVAAGTLPPDLRTVPGGLEGPSYPVYVDPIGVLGRGALAGRVGRFAPMNSPGFARININLQTPSTGNTFADALRWYSLQDEIDFDDNGLPLLIGNEVQREPRYTWAYLFRRPDASVLPIVDLTIVVYAGRPLQTPTEEPTYGPVTFQIDSKEVIITWDPATQPRPPIRKGGWILDATVLNAAGTPSPHGFFYRVVNVNDTTSAVAGQMALTLDLETFPKRATTVGVVVVPEYVAEVFEKAGDWRP